MATIVGLGLITAILAGCDDKKPVCGTPVETTVPAAPAGTYREMALGLFDNTLSETEINRTVALLRKLNHGAEPQAGGMSLIPPKGSCHFEG